MACSWDPLNSVADKGWTGSMPGAFWERASGAGVRGWGELPHNIVSGIRNVPLGLLGPFFPKNFILF